MIDSNLGKNKQQINNDFVVIIENDENEEGFYDFVTIDEDFLEKSVIIDILQDNPENTFIIDVELDSNSESFVTIDDQVFTLDFTENDFFDNWIDSDSQKK
jgi:Rap/ran-GAP.